MWVAYHMAFIRLWWGGVGFLKDKLVWAFLMSDTPSGVANVAGSWLILFPYMNFMAVLDVFKSWRTHNFWT